MRAFVISFMVFMIGLSLWLAGLRVFTHDIAGNNTAIEKIKPSDAIVALTGGSNRLQTAFDLLEAGKGRKLFISGVYRGVEVQELLKMWKHGDQQGLDCCVVLGFDADDTIGNARETIAWMRKENYDSMILVTANYHLKRARVAFRRFAPDIKIRAYPVTPQGLDMNVWWRDARYRSLIVREYNKYILSYLLYFLPGSPA
jgi:uncharacterized SAM-binding protein YcdF (DUF218 family)